MKSKIIKRADIVLIVVVLMISAMFILLRNSDDSGKVATVTIDGVIVETIDLSKINREEIRSYLNGDVQLRLNNNEISFHYSSCKSQICVNTGILRNNGDTAACLPNRVLVSIKSNGKSGQFQTF